tara:strand:- start:16870 stop:17550 length:681 start_codon:yes stop_codon:yes gene_type:complete
MPPKYRNMSAFDPYESRYELSVIGDKLAELEKEQSQRIEASAKIAGDLHGMWSEQQTFDTNKMLDIKDAQDNPIYEKSTNVFQDLYTPAGGRVSLTDAGKTATTPSILENQSYMPNKSAINKGANLLKPEMEDVRGATNIGDQTKEGVKSLTKKVKGVADSAVEGAKSAAGNNLINLLGKSLAIGAIGYGLANRDRLSAIPSAIGIGAPVLGGLLSLGNFLSKRRK